MAIRSDPGSHFQVIPEIDTALGSEERIAPFLISDEDLDGVRMVAAVVDAMQRPGGIGPPYRIQLWQAFLQYFDSETLSQYSDDVESEFDAALDRAVELDIVLDQKMDNDGTSRYLGGIRESRS